VVVFVFLSQQRSPLLRRCWAHVIDSIAVMETREPQSRKCAKCEQTLDIAEFPLKRRAARFKGERIWTCEACEAKRKKRMTEKKNTDKENQIKPGDSDQVDIGGNDVTAHNNVDRRNLPPISMEDFLAILPESCNISANINVLPFWDGNGDLRSLGNILAKLVWERTGYRFL
jgi:hypothetical protein